MRPDDLTSPAQDSPAGKLRQNTTGGSEPREQQQRLTPDPTAPRGHEPPDSSHEQSGPSPGPTSLIQLPLGATFGRSEQLSPQERERLAAYAARVLAEMEGETDRRPLPPRESDTPG